MPANGVSRAAENKRIRQEALREQLASQKHVEKVIDSISKLEDLDTELEANSANRLKSAIDSRLKLVNKYLPDLKATEHSGELDHNVLYRPIIKRFDGSTDEDA